MNQQLQDIQKATGIKMGNYPNKKNELYHQGQLILKALETYIKEAEYYQMTNEQFFIDFEDRINELSIKDHEIRIP